MSKSGNSTLTCRMGFHHASSHAISIFSGSRFNTSCGNEPPRGMAGLSVILRRRDPGGYSSGSTNISSEVTPHTLTPLSQTDARHRHLRPPSPTRLYTLSVLDTRRQVAISQSDVTTRCRRCRCNVFGEHAPQSLPCRPAPTDTTASPAACSHVSKLCTLWEGKNPYMVRLGIMLPGLCRPAGVQATV